MFSEIFSASLLIRPLYAQISSSAPCIQTTLTYVRTSTFWRRNYFFLILAYPVYKMWIIQEPNKLELWNKLRFEGKKTESIHHV